MNFSSKKLFCLMVAAILSCFTITHVSADQADQLNFKLTFTPSLSTTSSPKIYATISAICTDKNNNYYPQIEQNWYDEKVLIKRSNADFVQIVPRVKILRSRVINYLSQLIEKANHHHL